MADVLQELARNNTRFRQHAAKCKVCQLPNEVLAEVEKMWLSGASAPEIVQWLQDQHHTTIASAVIRRHFDLLTETLPADVLPRLKHAADELNLKPKEETPQEKLLRQLREVEAARQDLSHTLWTVMVPRFVQRMRAKAEEDETPLRELTMAFDSLLKAANLLSGEPTDRVQTDVSVSSDKTVEDVSITEALKLSAEALRQANKVLAGDRDVDNE